MTKFRYIISIVIIITIFSCAKEDEKNNIAQQEEQIEKYINSLEDAKVIFSDSDVWRVITKDGNSEKVAKPGDSIFFYYAAYIFSNGKGRLYHTNIKEVAVANNFNIDMNQFEIKKDIVGKGKLIKGLDIGLIGAAKDEECAIIYSAKNGFGNQQVGLVPKLSAHYVEVWIKDIKQN